MKNNKNAKRFTSYENINMQAVPSTKTIREISKGYVNESETERGGVTSMCGKLNIRPRYQRSYVNENNTVWKENLINSILCNYPINRMYFGQVRENELEVVDGQQRIITICDFINGKFSIKWKDKLCYFEQLSEVEKNKFLDYELDVTTCIGDEISRIAWFKRINQPNALLTEQELRNSSYIGEWLEDAKSYFCAPTSNVKKEINDKERDNKYCIMRYCKASQIDRCEFLEVALDWAGYIEYPELREPSNKDERICRYMAEHQNDLNANGLKDTYKSVVDWITDTFWKDKEKDGYPDLSKDQCFRGVNWVRLFCEYGGNQYTYSNKKHFTEVCDDIRKKHSSSGVFSNFNGIFEWVIRGEHDYEINTYLALKGFKDEFKKNAYGAQGGIDPIDGKHYEFGEMHAHHIVSWKAGGTNDYRNLVMLSKENHIRYHAGEYGLNPNDLMKLRDDLCKKVLEIKTNK